MKNKKKKGDYGYRDYHKKVRIAQILFGIVMILIQLAARNLTENQSVKNILTVLAVLSVLPTANVASPLLASWKYKTSNLDFYKKITIYEEKFDLLYDLIITSKEFIMPADVVVVHPLGVYIYCTSAKIDPKKAEKFLNEMFTGHKLDPRVKVIKDEVSFFHRLESLAAKTEFEDDGSIDYSINLLKNLSM